MAIFTDESKRRAFFEAAIKRKGFRQACDELGEEYALVREFFAVQTGMSFGERYRRDNEGKKR